MKRVGKLFEKLISDENLNLAVDEVNRTHHWKAHHKPNATTAWVEETKTERVKDLHRIITEGFKPKTPKVMERYDVSAGKWRTISEPIQWPDQYVHHALIQTLQPVMMRGMDRYACGSIRNRGTHYAKYAIDKWMAKDVKGTRYCLQADIRHFYDSLKPEVVLERMKQLIKDRQVLDLIDRVTKDGIKIGAYPSQWFANTTLQPMDMMIRQSGVCKHYVRYMDNLTIFGSNKRKLRKLKARIEAWLNAHGLELKGDWQVFPVKSDRYPKGRMPDAVGYRYGRGYSIPRKWNYLRLKRAMNKYRKRKAQGRDIPVRMADSILSRTGQLKHCNNVHAYAELFKGERVVWELKKVVRASRKSQMTWGEYMAGRANARKERMSA